MSLMPSRYQKFGKTAKGDPRYRCKSCKKTVSVGSPTRRHKQTSDTASILRCLVNKVPLSRICEMHDVSLKQVHGKIDFLYRQVTAFARDRENYLHLCFEDQDPYFATDIQTILVNWPVKKRRGTIPLLHRATVHKYSQFVVASTVDYDPAVDPRDLQEAMEQCGDFEINRSMRKHARLWSYKEYSQSLARQMLLGHSIDDLAVGGELKLPGHGTRVRGDAFQYAHMMLVKKLIGQQFNVANYCLDAESGLAAAICALNVDLVKSERVNVFEIRFVKGLTNDERLSYVNEGRRMFRYIEAGYRSLIPLVQEKYPELTDMQAGMAIHLNNMFESKTSEERIQAFNREGVMWPFHTKAEPLKIVRWATLADSMRWVDLGQMLSLASLHPVDSYFNFARRRVAGFERGILSSLI